MKFQERESVPTRPVDQHEDAKTRSFGDGSEEIIGACIEVHRHLGPGLLESVYKECLCRELALRGLRFEHELSIPVDYKGVRLSCGYRVDFMINGNVILEVKSVEQLLPVHQAQVLTYLRLTGLKTGLLVNFNVPLLKSGLKRLILTPKTPS